MHVSRLYNFFSCNKGLQLALHSPKISMKDKFEVTPQFHEAGFDSYCTGNNYSFVILQQIKFAAHGMAYVDLGRIFGVISECMNDVVSGYCFIRLCHWSACHKQGSDHVMSSTEHLNSLKMYCNRINISRATQLYIVGSLIFYI